MPSSLYGTPNGLQTPAFAASYTPNPHLGDTIFITLTGNITINNPSPKGLGGQKMTFVLAQDPTGTRTMAFGGNYNVLWTPNTTGFKINTITFVCRDEINNFWSQISSVVGL
jgi:hypothetical protein